MSSGVDSSVAAALLLRSGHPRENLLPFYMANWSPSASPDPILPPPSASGRAWQNRASTPPQSSKAPSKCTEREYNDVKDVCRALGLHEPIYMNFEKEYWCEVFAPMLEMYRCGMTPNPDVECNRRIKFGAVIKRLKDEFHRKSERVTEKESKWWLATGKCIPLGPRRMISAPSLFSNPICIRISLSATDLSHQATTLMSYIIPLLEPPTCFVLSI